MKPLDGLRLHILHELARLACQCTDAGNSVHNVGLAQARVASRAGDTTDVTPSKAIQQILDTAGPMEGYDLEGALQDRYPGWSHREFRPGSAGDVVAIHDELFVRESWMYDRVFTHRLTEAEVDSDLLEVLADLGVVLNLTDPAVDDWELTDGTPVTSIGPWSPESEIEIPAALEDVEILFAFPPHWLTDNEFQQGDLIGFRFGPQGWSWEKVSDPGNGMEVQERLWAAAETAPVLVQHEVWSLVFSGEAFRSPVLPLGEIARAAGLKGVRLGDLRRPGVDYSPHINQQMAQQLQRLHGTDLQDGVTLAQFESAAARGIDDRLDRAEILAAIGRNTDAACELLELPATLRPAKALEALDWLGEPPRAAGSTVAYLRGFALHELGDYLAAESAVEEAVRLDSSNQPALALMAEFAGLRGDAHRALDLHERSGAPQEDMVDVWRRYVDASPVVGRNEPCPCGSGKKFKKCHLGKTLSPLSQRDFWLSRKLYHMASELDSETLIDLTRVLMANGIPAEEAVGDPLSYELLLFEGGLIDAVLALIGQMLPADEFELAQLWREGQPRSVFEVQAVRPGASVQLRDLRTGKNWEVVERTASRTLRKGQLILTRVAPAGGEYHMFGQVHRVSPPWLETVMEAMDNPNVDLAERCDIYTSYLRPPSLVAGSGEQLIACKATIDPQGDVRVLDQVFTPANEGWVDLNGQTLRAQIRRRGDRLEVEAMTTTRFAQCLAAIRTALPAAVVLERSEESIETLAPDDFLHESPPTTSEEHALVAQFIRSYEQRWLDDSIPALGGATPKEAAADPTRREDLIRLLDTFPPARSGTEMDPERLRRLLGL